MVVHRPDAKLLHPTITTLHTNLLEAFEEQLIEDAHFIIVDHGPDHNQNRTLIGSFIDGWDCGPVNIVRADNRGYGSGHNLAARHGRSSYHLILNPDVAIQPGALSAGLRYLDDHPGVGLITPKAFDGGGKRQYLCKRYPAVLDLFARGYGSRVAGSFFHDRIANYELRGITEDSIVDDVPVASGCFMLMRRQAFDSVGGFDSDFFMYFEDFDLSIRLRQTGWRIIYMPEVKITHYGGMAARKGIKHDSMFYRSALRFFNKHGWKWA